MTVIGTNFDAGGITINIGFSTIAFEWAENLALGYSEDLAAFLFPTIAKVMAVVTVAVSDRLRRAYHEFPKIAKVTAVVT